ncbi:MAG: MarR family transcriptional regulator [Candidatus Pacebacteria bacterium]|nr:MarR family transcriptional regulator [Candidatus Paceibacterota bacterium]MDR3583109.1 MarR family transcriptional regulator [Candidatus Paceibacterota bacterium]
MKKDDQISQIITLMSTIRNLMHGRVADKKVNGISFLQLVTLRYIKEDKPLMKDIADFLTITPPSATSFVETLCQAGLAARFADPDDRRAVRIAITKKGEENLEAGMEAMTIKMRKELEKLNRQEQENLVNILQKMISNL